MTGSGVIRHYFACKDGGLRFAHLPYGSVTFCHPAEKARLYTLPAAVYIAGQAARAGERRGNKQLREREKSMKHVYVPRTTTYNLTPGEELNDLRMSDELRPFYEHV